MRKVITVSIPEEVLVEIDKKRGQQGRSGYVVDSVRMRVSSKVGSTTKTAAEKKNRESFGSAGGGREGGAAGPRKASGSGGSSEASERSGRHGVAFGAAYDGDLDVGSAVANAKNPAAIDSSLTGEPDLTTRLTSPGGAATGDDLKLDPEELQRVIGTLSHPNNPEDVAAWKERDRQAAAMLSPAQALDPVVVFTLPDKWPWDGFGEKPSTQHFASPNPGPHLLRDKKGNTAYCRPDSCKFCAEGVPPTGDHQAKLVDEIDLRDYASVEIEQEMSIEEAKKRFPQWSPERLKELADAESVAIDATGGLLAVSPEILGEMLQEGGIEAVKQHFADHSPADVVAKAQSIVNDNTSPESPAPEKGLDVDQKATRTGGSGETQTGKERDLARGLQPWSAGRGKNGAVGRGNQRKAAGRSDPQHPQAERVMPTGSHPKIINSPADVAKVLPPMTPRVAHAPGCKCLMCRPTKESK